MRLDQEGAERTMILFFGDSIAKRVLSVNSPIWSGCRCLHFPKSPASISFLSVSKQINYLDEYVSPQVAIEYKSFCGGIRY